MNMFCGEYDNSSSGSDSEESFGNIKDAIKNDHSTKTSLLSRFVIHLDVDCFYCQCEEIKNPSLRTRPVAIGQKHIIVTSNYIARSLGVKKLQSRTGAMEACPSLLIIEGSDIEPYRDASRAIYDAFRKAVKCLNDENATKKGGMDEYFADITPAVEQEWRNNWLQSFSQSDVWIYGENAKSSCIEIREDQSGATSKSRYHQEENEQIMWGNEKEIFECTQKLKIAAQLAKRIQGEVKAATQFSTTVGTSTSPMLAKIGSDLKKPKSCNILYPWRTKTIINDMPLRRIPDLGSRTLRAILPLLERFNGTKDPEFWTCRDLLKVPQYLLQQEISRDKDGSLCEILINRCKGIDTLTIQDDDGGINKTVSVEDSFIRSSLTSMEGVKEKLGVLFERILRLLDKRKIISQYPQDAYPRVLRLTARIVDRSITSRRPFRNISKQIPFDGKLMMNMTSDDERTDMLRRRTFTLLPMIRIATEGLNVTRLNLATSSFKDVELSCTQKQEDVGGNVQRNIASFFAPSKRKIDIEVDEELKKDYAEKVIGESRFQHDHEQDKEVPLSEGSTQQKDIHSPKSMKDVIENLKRKRLVKRRRK
ncbi:DNA polymerase iota [Chaetoceros tenuissimus]|uniref:DNA polymerase iota n=1 Tax=Chaetoceros tenuissimus TaxID=426638 RepID=A0AAD3HCQ0_9STRA|nr:DNA polymerase iota [Chaetoceros tenuissimus]